MTSYLKNCSLAKACCKTPSWAWCLVRLHGEEVAALALGYRSGRQPCSRPGSLRRRPVALGYPAAEDRRRARSIVPSQQRETRALRRAPDAVHGS